MLGAALIERLLTGVHALLPSLPGEVTVEANPESATPDFIRACEASGVTRLSLGVQSLQPETRAAVGRIGNPDRILSAVEAVNRRFSGSLSVDLISGLPLQPLESLADDIDFAASCGADHVSLYALTLEPGTALHGRAAAGTAELPSRDTADELWIAGRDALERRGFRQYEVSNFAVPGRESRHNQRYWRLESYIGCGPGAVGTVVNETGATAVRHAWEADLSRWLRGEDHRPERETISRKEFLIECLMMGFRTRSGVDGSLFRRRFGAGPEAFVGRTLERWRARGLAEGGRPALNRDGLLRLNAFLLECLEELDDSYPRYEERRR